MIGPRMLELLAEMDRREQIGDGTTWGELTVVGRKRAVSLERSGLVLWGYGRPGDEHSAVITDAGRAVLAEGREG